MPTHITHGLKSRRRQSLSPPGLGRSFRLAGPPLLIKRHPIEQKLCGSATSYQRYFRMRGLRHTATDRTGAKTSKQVYANVESNCLTCFFRSEPRRLAGLYWAFCIDHYSELVQERPMVFIGHSMGGLIIKQVRVVLAQNSSYTNLHIGASIGRPW